MDKKTGCTLNDYILFFILLPPSILIVRDNLIFILSDFLSFILCRISDHNIEQ